MTLFSTQRLQLCTLQLTDAAFVMELLNSPGWLHYIGNRNIYSLSDAENYLINGPQKSYQEHGHGLWKVILKDTTQSIGLCGILKRPEFDLPDLGYAFLPAFHGKGYAQEAAESTLQYAVNLLNIKELYATVMPENIRSVYLLKNLGFQIKELINNTEGVSVEKYFIQLENT
jgi:[ribosomal protein S5]-alanine N-acetyltransferase